ncbi:MAG: ABC transporter ATP-binding protein [Epulopiscium sp.]|nr:ABC transporter ATP-binding protein [Candidatus Epulonipiscium sp.]
MGVLISTKNMNKNYKDIQALKNINITIVPGTFNVIMGHSGSGKTTLLNILGLLDEPSSGEIYIGDQPVSDFTNTQKAKLRMETFGFVFQSFYLNPRMKAYENVMVPMYINEKYKGKDLKHMALELLSRFGLAERVNHFPYELSGGEQQRVAIARALSNNPSCILADEPSGNLDEENEKIVMDYLKELTKQGKSVVVVSHNPFVETYGDHRYYINKGILEEKTNGF